MRERIIAAALGLLVCFFAAVGPATAKPPCGKKVKRILAETEDKIRFEAFLRKQTIKPSESVTIFYNVINGSDRTIYLITEPTPEITFEDDRLIVRPPIPGPDELRRYDYEFAKVPRGKSRSGTLVIHSDKYPKDPRLESEDWCIEIGFGYVTDITGLNRKPALGEDPVKLRGLLFERGLSVLVGQLGFEVWHSETKPQR